jgi:DNA helicase-2/ATP-dependent DNA helicase PcrA
MAHVAHQWPPTAEQDAVINHPGDRHGRVLAGPGTGKSATVIRLLLRLRADGVRGRLLTFTRAAMNELKEKVSEHPEDLPTPSTVHSFAIATLLSNPGTSGLPEPIRIADDWEWKFLIREHLKDMIECSVRLIDRAKQEMASNWESLEQVDDPDLPAEVRNQFSGVWFEHRTIFGYSLLAELPFRLLRALQDHDDIDIGDWSIAVVDEYQDLNQCDLSMLRELTQRDRKLLASGDDDQSIYSFRRAHPVGIRRFVHDDYPGAADYTLSISQRCGTAILAWARFVIEGLPGRPARRQLTPAAHCCEGEARYLQFPNWTQEAAGAARLAAWLIDVRHVPPEDIAIMFRTNRSNLWSDPIASELGSRAVPWVDSSEVSQMVSEDANRRLLALARLVVDRSDSLAWWTLLHLTPGVGDATRDKIYGSARDSQSRFGGQLLEDYATGFVDYGPVANRLVALVRPILELIEQVDIEHVDRGDHRWGTWLAEQADIFGECDERFAQLLKDVDEVVDPREGLRRFIGQIQPVGNDLRSGRVAGAVRLMSMASSKGLTVRAAIVVGVEEGIVPLEGDGRDPAEERRLLYVAMTRATEYLYLTWSSRRNGPTARTGAPRVGRARNRSPLLTLGPVGSENGRNYLRDINA